MMQPVMVGAYQHEVGQFGGPAVLPVPDVVSMETAGGSATGNHARAVAVLEGAAKPTVDHSGGPAGADRSVADNQEINALNDEKKRLQDIVRAVAEKYGRP